MIKLQGNSGYHIRNYNFKMILYAILLSIIGILVVNSASVNEVQSGMLTTTEKQILGVCMGLVIMTILSLIDYHIWIRYAWVIYLLSLLALVYVRFIGGAAYLGARRWVYLPGFGTVQPSEFAKLGIILMSALLLERLGKRINHLLYLLLFVVIMGISVGLILIEPDLSTSVVICVALALMIFAAEISWKWVAGVVGAVAVVAALLLAAVYQPEQTILNQLVDAGIVQDYQLNRINAYFFPEEHTDLVRQQVNSVMAIGGGQLNGKGLLTSSLESVKNGNFLSEESSDFIFAVVGEELGFTGSCFILVLLLLIMIEGFRISARSRDMSGKLTAVGIVSMLGFQSFVNMGVAMQILPNTGTPLPFISAGMSSLIGTYMMLGILLNIGMQRRNYY